MMYLFYLLGFELCAINSLEYPSMSCWETGYVNDWDDEHRLDLTTSFINGQYSIHDNKKEDRRFKWRHCRPTTDSTPQGRDISLPRTNYDDSWSRGCGGNTGLIYAYSHHNNDAEDREWDFKCSELNSTNFIMADCYETGWKNEFDKTLDYDCPHNGIMRTMHSEHDNKKEDRRFKFECCRIANNEYEYAPMTCTEDYGYRNEMDGDHSNVQESKFLSGQYSYHDNYHEDRQFKWTYCAPSASVAAFLYIGDLVETDLDGEWTESQASCRDFNNGHAALIGGTSTHDNSREDRRWKFQCGLLNTRLYSLVNCGYTGELNTLDGVLDFDCPNNGVIRSIQSWHDNGHEDRKWRFECCQIASYNHSDAAGYWFPVLSVEGGDPFTYTISEGIEETKSEEVSEEYSSSLSATVSAGFEYEYSGATIYGSISITGETSQTTTNTVASSFTQFKTAERAIECSNDHLYQWRTTVKETLPNINSRTITIDSLSFLCTDNEVPQCPAGWCLDDDCSECKDGYPYSLPDNKGQRRLIQMAQAQAQ